MTRQTFRLETDYGSQSRPRAGIGAGVSIARWLSVLALVLIQVVVLVLASSESLHQQWHAEHDEEKHAEEHFCLVVLLQEGQMDGPGPSFFTLVKQQIATTVAFPPDLRPANAGPKQTVAPRAPPLF